jgi:alkylation response protein AidB-like acyl-CoA dehydrogenase
VTRSAGGRLLAEPASVSPVGFRSGLGACGDSQGAARRAGSLARESLARSVELAEQVLASAVAEAAGLAPPGSGAVAAVLERAGEPLAPTARLDGIRLRGQKWRVADLPETTSYLVLAQGESSLAVGLAVSGTGVEVSNLRFDGFGVRRADVGFDADVVAVGAISDVQLDAALGQAGLVLAAGLSARLELVVDQAVAAASALEADGRSPFVGQPGQFALSDAWASAVAANRLVAQAADLLAENGWSDREARRAAWVAKLVASEGFLAAVSSLVVVFGPQAEGLLDPEGLLLAGHEACSAFVGNRDLRRRLAALAGMDA